MVKASGEQQPQYGAGDTSFQATGREEGLQKLVDDFYILQIWLNHETSSHGFCVAG